MPEGDGRWVEYAGSYSDMLAQRGSELARPKPKREVREAAKAAPPVTPEPPARRRMTFKDKHALDTLPKTIASLQEGMRKLQAKLDDPKFYARDRSGFEKVSVAMGDLQQRIAAAEEQWLELEILREELTG